MCGEKYEKEVRVGGEEETSLEFKVDLLVVDGLDKNDLRFPDLESGRDTTTKWERIWTRVLDSTY